MRKPTVKSIIIKLFILFSFVFLLNLISATIAPVTQNELAMMQMENTIESSMGIQLYSYIKDYSWVVIVFVTAMLFYKEIKFIFNKAKEIFKNEEL